MPCYEFNYTSNQPQLLPNVWIPCPSGDNCCIGLDTCMSNNICRDYGVNAKLQARGGSYSSYYNARCTDPTYTSPACDKICINAPPDIVYNYTSQRWACCGLDKSGDMSCNAPIVGEYYEAPAPADLATLSKGAVYVPTATLTPDPGNHPTTYTFTTGSSAYTSTSASSSSSSSSPSTSSASSSFGLSASPSQPAATSSGSSSLPATTTGLSTGAKAGIGIGVAVGVITILALAAFILLRRRHRRNDSSARQHMIEMPNHPNPSHSQVYEKDAPTLPPIELNSSESEHHAHSLSPIEASNAFSFSPSIR